MKPEQISLRGRQGKAIKDLFEKVLLLLTLKKKHETWKSDFLANQT